MALLLLAYDESLVEYDEQDFRDVIIEFFLEKEPLCSLESPVKSTIYIKTTKPLPLSYWDTHLRARFDDSFKFTIALVTERQGVRSPIYGRKTRADEDIFSSFRDKFRKIGKKFIRAYLTRKLRS